MRASQPGNCPVPPVSVAPKDTTHPVPPTTKVGRWGCSRLQGGSLQSHRCRPPETDGVTALHSTPAAGGGQYCRPLLILSLQTFECPLRLNTSIWILKDSFQRPWRLVDTTSLLSLHTTTPPHSINSSRTSRPPTLANAALYAASVCDPAYSTGRRGQRLHSTTLNPPRYRTIAGNRLAFFLSWDPHSKILQVHERVQDFCALE